MDSRFDQLASALADIQAQLKDINQSLYKSQERLTKLETPLEQRSKRKGKRGPLAQYQNDWYLTSTQLDVPTFDSRLDYFGRLNPQSFLNWLQSVDMYFTWYPFSEAEKVWFATIKLNRQVSQYWTSVKTSKKAWFQQLIETWFAMKDELKGKYVPSYYYNHLLDKRRRITQGNKFAMEYVTESDEFLTHCNIIGIESDIQVFFEFRARLIVD